MSKKTTVVELRQSNTKFKEIWPGLKPTDWRYEILAYEVFVNGMESSHPFWYSEKENVFESLGCINKALSENVLDMNSGEFPDNLKISLCSHNDYFYGIIYCMHIVRKQNLINLTLVFKLEDEFKEKLDCDLFAFADELYMETLKAGIKTECVEWDDMPAVLFHFNHETNRTFRVMLEEDLKTIDVLIKCSYENTASDNKKMKPYSSIIVW